MQKQFFGQGARIQVFDLYTFAQANSFKPWWLTALLLLNTPLQQHHLLIDGKRTLTGETLCQQENHNSMPLVRKPLFQLPGSD